MTRCGDNPRTDHEALAQGVAPAMRCTHSTIGTNFVFYWFRVMKNITVTRSEDVARWLRIRAAENENSVSRWLADQLEGMKRRDDEYGIAIRRRAR